MKLITQSPKKALKAFLKQRPTENERVKFKKNLIVLLDKLSIIEKQPKDESEEHLKNNLRDFLRDTFYIDSNAINTKDKKDLVIHIDKTTDSDVAVIIEAKRPSNVKEFITSENANKKALHELILYYFNERNAKENVQLKHLVITDIYQWFIIDANYFDKNIYRNTQIRNLYETKVNDKKDNPWFYEEIAKIISKINIDLPCVYFNIRDYEKILRNSKTDDDKELVALYKILSPQHLLKISTPNDSNRLDEKFYKELLHIIGLEEAKKGTKNVIRRKIENRNNASLIELTIDALNTEDNYRRIPEIKIYGEIKEEQIFNIALELCITWINRILFLKLLEGQLISYHEGNKDYRFLNSETIQDFAELFKLFHKVLAVNITERTVVIKQKYNNIPYLNSSLFEISDLEDQTIKINSLENVEILEFINTTVLKEIKKKGDKIPTLNYLFHFLDAYDFSSEGTEDWQKDNKQLINASVLGKVFEKINGYRDGSIFTPAFITMYMCRQSIRLAVLEKFNEELSEKKDKNLFDKFEDIKNYTSKHYKTDDILRINKIIDSLHICDPAVGSGHFLVSALNEIIAIKAELGILADDKGNIINKYDIEILNDELVITDYEGNPVEYKIKNGKPISKEIQILQKTLFQQKQTIIENCLFGVDINPKSVLICRLRLWIELLKNAYYKEDDYNELETLPNIDINIKCGNSLLNKFDLTSDLSDVFKKQKFNYKTYRDAVDAYKNSIDKNAKQKLLDFINDIKIQFKTVFYNNDPLVKLLSKFRGQRALLDNNIDIYGNQIIDKEKIENDKINLDKLIASTEEKIFELKNNVIYRNSFEWRFEFPEVLNNKGLFEGFDLIIGNPPYIKEYENKSAFNGLRKLECYQGKMDIWYLFGDLGLKLLKPKYYLCFIATNNWVTNAGASKFRNIVIQNSKVESLIDFGAYMIFENASIQTMIMLYKNTKSADNYTFDYRKLEGDKLVLQDVLNLLEATETEKSVLLSPVVVKANMINKPLTFNTDENSGLLDKLKAKQNFVLREKADKKLKLQSELGQGLVAPQDFVNKASAENLKGSISNGDGIFVLSNAEFEAKKFLAKEKEIIKPYFTTDQLQKYCGNPENTHWIIYTKSDISKPDKKTKKIPIDSYPKIKQHLDTFKSVITSDFGPYGLHRAREQYFFEGEKIMVTRKCPKEPIFTYTDFDCFVSQTFFVIQSNRINLKYLTGLLNSKLIEFWLRKKGKMQGNNYQLDKQPLLEIPIYKPTEKVTKEISKLVDEIISIRQQGNDSSDQEKIIDKIVYQLYELTPEEIAIVEGTK